LAKKALLKAYAKHENSGAFLFKGTGKVELQLLLPSTLGEWTCFCCFFLWVEFGLVSKPNLLVF
jgi:hypothetical protein